MPDIEKVIEALENADMTDGVIKMSNQFRDIVVELLKEHEPVVPVLEQDSMVCGNCGHEVIWQKWLNGDVWLDEQLDYCPHCGRSVKW